MTAGQTSSGNFEFLRQHDPLLVQLCAAAERNLTARDSNTCLLKLLQFGEALARHVAALLGSLVPRSGAAPTSAWPERRAVPSHTLLHFDSDTHDA